MEVDAASTADSHGPRPGHRWGPVRISIVVLLLALAGLGGTVWWAGRCHDGYCTGSTHHVTIEVRVTTTETPNCWNDIDDVKLDGRYWESRAHAPAAWGTGPVTGTFRVTGDGAHRLMDSTPGYRTAVFTADRGGSVAFFGGTAGFFDDLTCAINWAAWDAGP